MVETYLRDTPEIWWQDPYARRLADPLPPAARDDPALMAADHPSAGPRLDSALQAADHPQGGHRYDSAVDTVAGPGPALRGEGAASLAVAPSATSGTGRENTVDIFSLSMGLGNVIDQRV